MGNSSGRYDIYNFDWNFPRDDLLRLSWMKYRYSVYVHTNGLGKGKARGGIKYYNDIRDLPFLVRLTESGIVYMNTECGEYKLTIFGITLVRLYDKKYPLKKGISLRYLPVKKFTAVNKITYVAYRACKIILEYPEVTASEFANMMWPDKREQNSVKIKTKLKFANTKGAAQAGSFLGKLEKKGYVQKFPLMPPGLYVKLTTTGKNVITQFENDNPDKIFEP